MKMLKKWKLYLVFVLIVSTLSGCGYNKMQANEEGVKAAWVDVEASYQRRNDLIPNLVEVVKGYAAHDKETLEAVTEARGAFEWYQDRSDSAAQAFLAELDAAVAQLTESPERWPLFLKGTRRYLFRRFPFFLVWRSR